MIDVRNQRVLLFGDSLSSGTSSPGGRLLRELRAAGAAEARADARVGRSAHNFFAREAHADLLAADAAWGPTVAIVWLGTNDIGLNLEVDERALVRIRDALAATGARVLAITPPAFPTVPKLRDGRAAVSAMIRRVFTEVVDAGPVTPAGGRTRDGVHFTSKGAEAMARALLALLVPATSAAVPAVSRGSRLGIAGAVAVGAAGAIAWILSRRIAVTAREGGPVPRAAVRRAAPRWRALPGRRA